MVTTHVVVTGGSGFLGQQFIAALLASQGLPLGPDGATVPIESITAFDTGPSALTDPRLDSIVGDIADAGQVARLVRPDTALVVHLAAVVSGTAEADFDLGLRVNIDGTRAVLEACRAAGTVPRVLFPSSVAVFGGDLPDVVTDATNPTPQSSYGTHKRIGELLVQDYTRKGFIDGRSVRIPTVAVRPGTPNGAASGFASSIIREPLAGIEARLPVDPSTVMWVASPRAVVGMMLHAVSLPAAAWGWDRCLNLPGLSVSMQQELDALRAVSPEAAALVRHEVDPAVAAVVTTWATRFDTARATAMGFPADTDFAAVVAAYIEDNPHSVRLIALRS